MTEAYEVGNNDWIYPLRCNDCQEIFGYSLNVGITKKWCPKHAKVRNLIR